MNFVAVLALSGVITSLAYYAAATVAAIRFRRAAKKPMPALPKIAPRVAVLKPLRGRSSTLSANLTSYLESDYPRTEFYFGVPDYDDPATEVPVALRAQYQFAPITLVVGEDGDCMNRKVSKLIRMADRATRAEIFVLSDADVAVTRDHLRQIVSELTTDDRVGVVTCLYRAHPSASLAARLQALCVNTDFVPQVMLSNEIETVHYALGATIAIKRNALEEAGGFRRIKDLLADDYYLGKFATQAGYRVKLSSSIVTTFCDEHRFGDFWRHQLRWARVYRTTRPASLGTIMVHGPSWALLFLIATGFSGLAWAALAVVLGARIGMARFLVRRILGLNDLGRDAWMAPLKDLIMTGIWFASFASNEVQWAGRRLKILAGGKMREVKPPQKEVRVGRPVPANSGARQAARSE
jgi:ceramide glucosyltransferase